jgi:hypothetical protein
MRKFGSASSACPYRPDLSPLSGMDRIESCLDVRLWGKIGKAQNRANVVRFASESGHRATQLACPLCAISGHNAVQQTSTGLSSIFAVFG